MAITVGRTGDIGQGADALTQLRGFTDGLQGGDRLRGHKGADGNITLHVRTGAPSFWTKVSPKAIYHRHLAQKAIARVLTNAEGAAGGGSLSAAKNANAGGVRSGLDRLFKSGEITGAATKVVSEGAMAIRSSAQTPLADAASGGVAATVVDGHISDDASTVTIGNDTYTKVPNKQADGSEGVITFYMDNNRNEIALKFMKPSDFFPPEVQAAAMDREIEAHRQVGNAGHSNVLGFKGAIQGSDGRLGIAMEVAGSGTMEKASEAIKTALKDGLISSEAAQTMRLTLIKDMLTGMAHVNDTSGMAHLDLKLDNVFIDAAGVAKIADFGKTDFLSNKEHATDKDVRTQFDNALPPEIHTIVSDLQSKIESFSNDGARTQELRRDIIDNFPNLKSADIDVMFSKLYSDRQNRDHNKLYADRDLRKWDTWAAGAAAFSMVYGRNLVQDVTYMSDIAKYITAYGSSSATGPLQSTMDTGGRVGGVFGGSSGDAQLDNLLTQLLAPKAADRALVADVKDHDLFQSSKVGSDAARGLIVELLKDQPNPDQIEIMDALINLPG